MRHPTGFENKEQPDAVCKLNRKLYGLRQSSYAVKATFKASKTRLGFSELHYAEHAHMKGESGVWIIVVLCVDEVFYKLR